MIWERLAIEPTQDEKQIKRAYARQLKHHHPEDDPQGYQQLREAYDEALRLAKQSQRQESGDGWLDDGTDQDNNRYEDTDEQEEELHIPRLILTEQGDEQEEESHTPRLVVWEQQGDFAPDKHPVDRFMKQAEAVYQDYFARIDVKRWTELLSSDLIWNVEHRELLSRRLIHFLQDHDQLPSEVWRILDSNFNWRERISEDMAFAEPLTEEFIKHLTIQVRSPGLRFPFFDSEDKVDYDAFLRLRELALQALLEDELEAAEEYLDEAYSIYSKDPDLLRLQAEYYERTGNFDLALDACTQLIAGYPDEMDGYLYRARIWYKQDLYDEAVRECQFILSRMPENTAIRCLLAQSYMKLGYTEQAILCLEQVLESNPYDMTAVVLLAECRKKRTQAIRKQRDPGLEPELRKLREQLDYSGGKKERWRIVYLVAPKIRLAVCLILIIGMHLMMNHSFFQNTGYTVWEGVKKQVRGQMTENVATDPQDQLKAGNHLDPFTLTKASALGLYEYRRKDGQGVERMEFDSYQSLHKKGIKVGEETPTGWFYVGFRGDEGVVVVVDAEQAVELNKEKNGQMTAELTGRVRDATSEQLQELVQEVFEIRRLARYRDLPLIKDIYIDARIVDIEESESEEMNVDAMLLFFMVILLPMLYLHFIYGLLVVYRAARF
ncbi:tetratricopeptide repeat protein [Paenibacillus sp. NPDC058071]|uniref:tetratricopeptide repeat protein n=1 Tax=Paenibacillus sp. NPDC058071 TaxID=3346326 RepID=UPI0036D8AFC9